MKQEIETRCIHLDDEEKSPYGSISYPIFQTATFAHPRVGQSTGYDYTRHTNPTRNRLEKMIASLENGIDALAFSSGMSAITTMIELFQPGDHIIIEEDLYGGSIRLFENINKKNGIEFTALDIGSTDIEPYIKDNTKAVFIETPTNPMMHIVDIEKLSKIVHKHDAIFIVDNTFLSPYFQNPLDLGADIVIHSGTKYISGHNDTISGFFITNSSKISEEIRFIAKTTGSLLSPFDSWLVLRGMQTLSIRMKAAESNAKQLAEFLESIDVIDKVYYPGLKTHPGHEIMKKQARGFGAMVSFTVKSKEIAYKILENVNIIKFAESLGGTETLITYPLTQTHADVSDELRQKNGITDCLLRLSVGIENINDLMKDIENAVR